MQMKITSEMKVKEAEVHKLMKSTVLIGFPED
jgi:hypothetical protein